MRARTFARVILSFLLTLSSAALAQEPAPQEPPKPQPVPAQEAQPAAPPEPTAKEPAPKAEVPKPAPPATPEELQELVHRAILLDQQNYKEYKNLTHIERAQTEHLDKKDNVKKTEIVTKEVFILYGERVEHVLEKNDKPLSPDDARKEQEKFDKQVQKLKDESPEKRKKREEKFEEDTKKDREFIDDGMNAFSFTLLGEETVNGRPAWIVQGEPRPDYRPNVKNGAILKKLHGKIWIDQESSHWVKLDVEFTDTLSVGWFLARIHPGTRVQVEQVPFRDNIWVPTYVKFKLDARVALFKPYFANVDVSYRDWRRFSSDTKITGFADLETPKQQPASPTPQPQAPQ